VQIEDAPNANASHKVHLVWLVCVKKRCPRALAPVPWNAGIYIGRVARQRIAGIRRFPCDPLLAGPEKVPPEVFTKPFTNPVNGNPEAVHNNLREALRLLAVQQRANKLHATTMFFPHFVGDACSDTRDSC
jgi:hypothetical protein